MSVFICKHNCLLENRNFYNNTINECQFLKQMVIVIVYKTCE